VPLVKEIIEQRSTRYHSKIEGHVNRLIQPLLEPHNEKSVMLTTLMQKYNGRVGNIVINNFM
jgi:hypothetical protein